MHAYSGIHIIVLFGQRDTGFSRTAVNGRTHNITNTLRQAIFQHGLTVIVETIVVNMRMRIK